MRSTKNRRLLAAAAALVGFSLVAGACGDDDAGTSSSTTAAPASGSSTGDAGGGGSLSGSVVISGSSTVEPISAAVASRFKEKQPSVAVSVEGPGTGDGFAKFCAGETDISDASRPIKADEVEKCKSQGIDFVELKVAVDGLSVITSSKNDAIECLSFVDLYALLGPDATGVDNWKDASAAADEYAATVTDLGAVHTPYPDAPLTVTAPGEESGTFDSFVEIVIAKVGKKLGADDATVRPDYTASPNDNVIVEGIGANDTSLGWVGFAFVEENLDKIKPLQVDGGKGCVEPTDDTIASGEYPIARDLYIYVNKAKLDKNAALGAYVDFYLTQLAEDGVVGTDLDSGQVPYVPLAASDLAATKAVWEAKELGTRDGGK